MLPQAALKRVRVTHTLTHTHGKNKSANSGNGGRCDAGLEGAPLPPERGRKRRQTRKAHNKPARRSSVVSPIRRVGRPCDPRGERRGLNRSVSSSRSRPNFDDKYASLRRCKYTKVGVACRCCPRGPVGPVARVPNRRRQALGLKYTLCMHTYPAHTHARIAEQVPLKKPLKKRTLHQHGFRRPSTPAPVETTRQHHSQAAGRGN